MSHKRPRADVINFLERKAEYAERKFVSTVRLPPLDQEAITTSDVGILKMRNKILVVITQSDYGDNPPRVDTVTFGVDELSDVIETLTDAYEFVTKRDGEEP
jgi:hypothetical protein|tara:strand:+ start:40 stop:345 length:306 start_codon:yes stop_codon:yes gene_type:complete